MHPRDDNTAEPFYDYCIVGGGPAGLATLSALREPYTLTGVHVNDQSRIVRKLSSQAHHHKTTQYIQQHKAKKIAVIDASSDEWLSSWKTNFHKLDIQCLRSPMLAHCDAFDPNSLLAYAYTQNRQESDIYESASLINNKKLYSLGESQIGLWNLPSTSLFNDFCDDLSQRLVHDYICGTVTEINDDQNDDDTDNDDDENENENNDKKKKKETKTLSSTNNFRLTVDVTKKSKSKKKEIMIRTKAVILCLGSIGTPIIPRSLQAIQLTQSSSSSPSSSQLPFMCQWHQLQEYKQHLQQPQRKKILVVGGGLTAIQTAQYILKHKNNTVVYLCSRRRLQVKAFDVHDTWFDRRHSNRHISEFFHGTDEERLQILKEARNGGSVPPMYMQAIQSYIKSGRLILLTGEVLYNNNNNIDAEASTTDSSSSSDATSGATSASIKRIPVMITRIREPSNNDNINNDNDNDNSVLMTDAFDGIVLACGLQPDCTINPLIKSMQRRWPVPMIGGFPSVSEDLLWKSSRPNLCVVGFLGRYVVCVYNVCSMYVHL